MYIFAEIGGVYFFKKSRSDESDEHGDKEEYPKKRE
jgi:hypothetical protein